MIRDLAEPQGELTGHATDLRAGVAMCRVTDGSDD